ncbi:hypothetical protein I302_105470 [Kwoniella bestiolae CBS 10118]|uniref:Uncharacterized protein n=1 Tax=Kwoniella bestiolae CBS 10118 TaxID=1296100 RepID=A0A1B9FT74_9TREE|nr:hypothetical protein I302_08752 [Kwoniella bestiolae CBS 10118]OCF21971.1 hypothetical protein I302_08752 [Kwoniella bestiolae CBS 10118]
MVEPATSIPSSAGWSKPKVYSDSCPSLKYILRTSSTDKISADHLADGIRQFPEIRSYSYTDGPGGITRAHPATEDRTEQTSEDHQTGFIVSGFSVPIYTTAPDLEARESAHDRYMRGYVVPQALNYVREYSGNKVSKEDILSLVSSDQNKENGHNAYPDPAFAQFLIFSPKTSERKHVSGCSQPNCRGVLCLNDLRDRYNDSEDEMSVDGEVDDDDTEYAGDPHLWMDIAVLSREIEGIIKEVPGLEERVVRRPAVLPMSGKSEMRLTVHSYRPDLKLSGGELYTESKISFHPFDDCWSSLSR